MRTRVTVGARCGISASFPHFRTIGANRRYDQARERLGQLPAWGIHEEDICGPARVIRGNRPSIRATRPALPAARTALLGIRGPVSLAVRPGLRTDRMALLAMRGLVFLAVQLELPA